MIALIYSTPFIIRVCATLALILLVNKISKNLAISAIIGTALLALWCGHAVPAALLIAWNRISSANTLLLMFALVQIIFLSSQMSDSGVMKDLVESIRRRIPQKFSIAMLPAVIGLLPMPGGAIFSAPLVDECDDRKVIDPLLKTRINYWFRHVWEYWWPLYPGVLLAVDITGLTIPQFMLLQIPLSIMAVGCGYYFLLRKINVSGESPLPPDGGDTTSIVLPLAPILIIVTAYAFINIAFPFISRSNKYLPMIIGILLAQSFLQFYRPLNGKEWRKILLSQGTPKLILLVIAILVYGSFIETPLPDGSQLVSHLRQELASLGFPIIVIIIVIPFLCAFTTGLSVGFVGASFPIVMSLLGPDPGMGDLLSNTLLAYGAGYTGMILSPVHICLIVTNDHFETSLGESIIKLIPPSICILAASIIIYFIIKAVF